MDVVAKARELAASAYPDEGDMEHPREVAGLVEAAGFGPEVVTAALLHDVVEDGAADTAAIAAELGSHVAALVSTMTEDESISRYAERKAEHRNRACRAGREAAAIFIADKLSNARRMRRAAKEPKARKIAHYAATLELMRERYPDLPLLPELERELTALRAELQRAPA